MSKRSFIILMLLLAFKFLIAKPDETSRALDNNWFYHFSESQNPKWQVTASPSIGRSLSEPKIILLKTKLPDVKISHPALFIDDIYQSAQIFYQDSLIYSFGDLNEENPASRWVWHVVNLPADFQNKELIFKIRSDRQRIGLSKYIMIDSAEAIYQKIIKKDLLKLLCAAFLILFALIMLFLVIYLKQYIYTGLCGFILFIGLWAFANQHISQLYFNCPTLQYYLDVPSLMFSVACFFYYFRQVVVKKYRLISVIIQNLFLTVGLLSITVDIFTPIKIVDTLEYYITLLFFTSIALISILLKNPLKNSRDTKIFLSGMTICLTLAALETIFFLFRINPSLFGLSFSFLHIGTVLLVISWSLMLILRYVAAYNNYIVAHDIFSKRTLELQNEERKRIAADLHDAIGHDFLVIRTLAETGKKIPAKAENSFAEISTVSEQGVNNVRAICRSLYPPVLENIGLTQALKSLIKRSFSSSKIELDSFIEDIDSSFVKSDYIHIYRIMQEIINNIIKHSAADLVKIEIRQQAEQIVFEVADNGKGIEQSILSNIAINYNSFGLSGILERVKILKGQAEIKNNQPCGLTIKICFPLKSKG